jgi:integrase
VAEPKPFGISKRAVWEAHQAVKANRGAAGVDRQSLEGFEHDLTNNLYTLWNRLASGSYFPPPVLMVEIPKRGGGTRRLGVPTVSDRIAQMVTLSEVLPSRRRLAASDSRKRSQISLNDYRTNRKRSLDDVQRRIEKHLTPFFGNRRMTSITTVDIRAYIAARQEETTVFRKAYTFTAPDGSPRNVPEQRRTVAGVSNSEINRELTALKRMFNLAIQAGKLLQKPHIPFLKEDNVRVGFFEREQFLSVLQRLPEPVRPVATFAYITGWRIDSEVLSLEWRQVDFSAGEVRFDPGRTKNGEGRTFPMTRDLREVLDHQRAITEILQRRHKVVCRSVFHRAGRPIKSFRVAFRTACVKAGCPGRVLHDFRRTAVRNLVRAGIPERVAMQMTGHKTRSVFERYNIVSAGDLRDAGKRLDAVAGTISGTIGQIQPARSKT